MMFETEIWAELHSYFNLSGLYCIKSLKICLYSGKHTAKFKKYLDFNTCTCFT